MSSNPKQQVTLIVFSSILAGFSLASIVVFVDPASTSRLILVFLYASLFLLSLGLFTLIGLGLRTRFWPGLYVVNLGNSFRQALLMAILICVSFLLLSHHLLFWWVEASLILFLGAIEAFLNLKI